MHTPTMSRPATLAYAAQEPTKPTPWHGLVVLDVLLNNLATGLFLVMALGELAKPALFAPLGWIAYPIALVLLAADLLCLVLDLGDPLRFHHMLRVFKPSSPMSLGTWCLTAFSLPLTVVVAVDLVWSVGWIHTIAVVAALLPALGSAVYKGVLFSTSSQPGWRDARWLGAYLANSALMLGCAGLLGLAFVLGQDRAAMVLRPALMLLLVFNLIPLGLLIASARPSLVRLGTPARLTGIAALALGVGLILPLGLLFVEGSPALTLGALLALLLGSLTIRYAIVMLPHGLPGHSGNGPG